MKPLLTSRIHAVTAVMGLCLLLTGAVMYAAQETDGLRYDPANIVGAERCSECHEPAVDQWETTSHYKTFNGADDVEAMHRREAAAETLDNLGERSAKRGVCTNCHYTMQAEEAGGRPRANYGVSCESCHGAAADWIEEHGVYGEDASGAKRTRETEPDDHREARLTTAEAGGMIRTDNPYALIQNCFQCHTVPNELLVNTGGHQAGSDFNILEWLAKEVRHNYLYSDGAENRAAPRDMDAVARSRVLLVLGEIIDVEYGLRGLASATTDGPFAEGLMARIAAGVEALEAIRAAEPAMAATLDTVLAAVAGADLGPNNGPAMLAAAETVGSAARSFSESEDGAGLGGLDALMPGAP